jgi:predicted aminopeptidase
MMADPQVSGPLRRQLEIATMARDFASEALGLPDNKSYRFYKDLGRSYATWTVTAAPELAIEPLTWCFPIAGCVSYRGYFSPGKAEKFAARLAAQGFDVDIGGVRAYSTVGWFADPLLNTFIRLPPAELAGLIFHELAHQRVYVKGDTVFNESFATTVELAGVQQWLRRRREEKALDVFRRARQREWAFADLVAGCRDRLAAVYAQDRPDPEKRELKQRLLDELRADFEALAGSWDRRDEYDAWLGDGLNNARLASIGAYHDRVPAFCASFTRCGGSWECFFAQVEQLAGLETGRRARALEELAGELPPDLRGCLIDFE